MRYFVIDREFWFDVICKGVIWVLFFVCILIEKEIKELFINNKIFVEFGLNLYIKWNYYIIIFNILLYKYMCRFVFLDVKFFRKVVLY